MTINVFTFLNSEYILYLGNDPDTNSVLIQRISDLRYLSFTNVPN